ncbi:MAG: alpha/beta hydrolase [bacterium]|nr:alpha/beta hydrolase [bacterium]
MVVKIVVLLLIVVMNVGGLVKIVIDLIRILIKKIVNKPLSNPITLIRKDAIFELSFLLLSISVVVITQLVVTTPSIKGKDSIAILNKIKVNGRNEWISIRGEHKDAPILLFLAGGPGGTQMAEVRYDLAQLEKNFVVVNWDQPGSGKSFGCTSTKKISIDTYIEDGIAVTEYLMNMMDKNEIYLIGESWGSALGIMLIKEKPEYYAGFVGTGQMVAFRETEERDYDLALKYLEKNGDESTYRRLVKQGRPWYNEGNMAMLSMTYLNVISGIMNNNPEITDNGYETLQIIFAPEYGLRDSICYLLGFIETFGHVYPQLKDVDLRKGYTDLEVPVYMFLGRHDLNAPIEIAEDFYQKLDCPQKEIVWFEHSGHNAKHNETEKFVSEINRVFQ